MAPKYVNLGSVLLDIPKGYVQPGDRLSLALRATIDEQGEPVWDDQAYEIEVTREATQ
jgi:hypothetical protein